MAQPVCVKCEVGFKPFLSGALIIETQRVKVGEEYENRPYRIWLGDIGKCPTCNHEAVIAFGRVPIIEMFEPQAATRLEDFKTKAKRVVYFHEKAPDDKRTL